MSLPRMAEVGDRALLHISKCLPVETDAIGPAVEFTGADPSDVITLRRDAVDARLREWGFVYGEKKGDDALVNYADTVGEWFLFLRTANPKPNGRPLWRMERAQAPDPSSAKAPPSAPVAPPRAEVSPSQPSPTDDKESQRQAIRDAYVRELAIVLEVMVPMLRKKKVSIEFQVNAAAAALTTEMSRKRCL